MIQEFHFWAFILRKQKDIIIPIFILVLFAIAKIWNQLKCPSMNERTEKMWCIYDGILLSHKKKRKSYHLQLHGQTPGALH